MNWFDWFLIVLAAIFVFEGLRQGLTRTVIGLLATLLGLFLAAWMYPTGAAILSPYISSEAMAKIAGFILIFVSIQLVGACIAWLLTKVWKVAMLTWLDRLLGGCFGLIKAALVGIILTMVLMAFPRMPVPLSVGNSKIAPYLAEASEVLTMLVPREMKEGFVATYEQVKKFWRENVPTGKSTPAKDSA